MQELARNLDHELRSGFRHGGLPFDGVRREHQRLMYVPIYACRSVGINILFEPRSSLRGSVTVS